MNRDLAFGTAGVVVAGGYYALAAAIPGSALADAVGPQGLPKTYAVVLSLLSLVLVVRSLRDPGSGIRDSENRRRTANAEPRIPDPSGSRTPEPGSRFHRVLGMLLIGVVYLLLVPWLGYMITLAGLILVTTWYQGGVINRTIAVVAVSGAIVFWLLFVLLLGIPHPAGVWTRLF